MKLKQKPEDFIVEEILDVPMAQSGKYAYVRATKRRWNTLDIVRRLSRSLCCPEKKIGFCGTKDREAVAVQYFSLPARCSKNLPLIKDVDFEVAGYGENPLFLGCHKANKFVITARETVPFSGGKYVVPNYFDSQRFSDGNEKKGLLMLQRDWKELCDVLKQDSEYGFAVKQHLEKNINDYVGAVRKLPRKLLKLFIHSYQSSVFNHLLIGECRKVKHTEYCGFCFPKEDIENVPKLLPLPGFGTEDSLDFQGLTNRSFIFREFPELSSEGAMRETITDVDIKILDKGKDWCTVEFVLPPGRYATIVIKCLASQESH